MKTYMVNVLGVATRTMTVRASSAEEAVAIAHERIHSQVGPWTIDFPGGNDEHWRVETPDGEWLGPDAIGNYFDSAFGLGQEGDR